MLKAISLSFDEGGPGPIRVRWVLALCMLAAAACIFLSEALYAAMDHNARFARAPAPFLWDDVAHAGVAGSRGDRLDPQRPGAAARSGSVRIEQLSSSGLSVRPFTHVAALLADVPAPPEANGVPPPAASPQPIDARLPATPLGESAKTRLGDLGSMARANGARSEPAPLGQAINVTPVQESAPAAPPVLRVIVARPGDDLSEILRALHMGEASAQSVAALYRRDAGPATFVGGEKISVLAPAAAMQAIAFSPLEIKVERDGATAWTVARTDGASYAVAAKQAAASPASPASASSEDTLSDGADESVQDSLYGLVQSHGVDRALVDQIVRLCAHDFDLAQPVMATDRIDFLSTPGDLNEPELRFVSLTLQGKTRSYYRFTAPDDGSVDYYDQNGRSVTKFLLRKPTPAGRLGDGFGWRIHPILKDRKFHEGVDYDAPMGSPIEAAGAGVVEKISQESGYGKYIRIRHDLGYETTYAHVYGFARGIRVGSRVRQGEVIAYVGSTGLSTGPHLYYEVRINGRNVDPLKIRLADGRVLSRSVLADFERRRDRTDQLIRASAVAENKVAEANDAD